MTAHERTDWRDRWPYDRPWLYDDRGPAVGLYWPVVEYHDRTPVALVDYRHREVAGPGLPSPAWQVLGNLYNSKRAPLPAWSAAYDPAGSYRVTTFNLMALWLFGSEVVELDERAYVAKLYEVRSRALPNLTLPTLDPATAENWSGQWMSKRRREYGCYGVDLDLDTPLLCGR